MSAKLLVTGGAGYIGSHVVALLIAQGYDVVVYDNLAAGHRQAVHNDATLFVGDLLNPAQIGAVFAAHHFDGIMHFASHIQVGESMRKPWLYLRDNVVAASYLLEAAAEHNVGRFILSSTAALFDNPQTIPIPADEPILPGSPYGEGKAIIERYLHWMEPIYGIKSAALRYFNAAGAHPDGHIGEDHDPETHLIPIVLQAALGQREHVTIFGQDYDTPDGTAIRDYIHVMDLASAHILAFEALADGRSRRYNLGTGSGYSVQQVVEAAREVTGRAIPVVYGARRPGDLARLVADSAAIQAELGWQPQFPDLHSIIETAWRWHSAHPNGYGDWGAF
ncbi:MAG: UDP-glucose 4-epimerase GalE [Chloroflexi bacterium]|nr:UDP-glucose 4-epimerase GalE [Chloroflexota bacterium]